MTVWLVIVVDCQNGCSCHIIHVTYSCHVMLESKLDWHIVAIPPAQDLD